MPRNVDIREGLSLIISDSEARDEKPLTGFRFTSIRAGSPKETERAPLEKLAPSLLKQAEIVHTDDTELIDNLDNYIMNLVDDPSHPRARNICPRRGKG